MAGFRTDLAMERTASGALCAGVRVERRSVGEAEIVCVQVENEAGEAALGKARGVYWTLTHPRLPYLMPEERMPLARQIAARLRRMLPKEGDVLVLGLGNRRMTADALGGRVVDGVLVTRHMRDPRFRGVCALAPGVLGVTGVETAEMALGLTEKLHPAAVIVVDALAAMETSHICTTVQLTDTGIRPGSGVGNHRAGISAETLRVPVIALGIPMVVYASTIIRDALRVILRKEADEERAETMAERLAENALGEMVVTPRDIDEWVQGLADMLALAVNAALQPAFSLEELSHYLH